MTFVGLGHWGERDYRSRWRYGDLVVESGEVGRWQINVGDKRWAILSSSK
jgi:hypothetical protein